MYTRIFLNFLSIFDHFICLQKAAEIINSCVTNLKSKRQVTFLTGSAGPLALGAVIYNKIDPEESREMILKLV